jgi:hypothetical protein
MIKVNIKKNNVLTNCGQFENIEKANTWLEECKANKSFGKTAGYYSEMDLTEEEKATATEIVEPTEMDPNRQYLIPNQFEEEVLDITNELAMQQSIQEGMKRQELGKKVIAAIFAINEVKELSAEQFTAILNDTNLLKIERLLINGSLRTAKLFIQALDNTFYTNEEKQTILDMLGEY